MLSSWFSIVVCIAFASTVAGDDKMPADSKTGESAESTEPNQYHKAFANWAREYVITTSDGTKVEVVPKPLLHWTNPVRNAESGSTFVWLHEGNPLVVGSFFTFEYEGVRSRHEFHSLASGPLKATFRGTNAWQPDKPGVTWTTFDNAQTPASSKPRRLVQMRQLARRFRAKIVPPVGQAQQLRMLSQPLLRYSSKKYDIEDAAVFSFVVATDPEALLFIRQAKVDDKAVWQYAIARFHYWALEASLDDKVVWKAKEDLAIMPLVIGDADRMQSNYIGFYPESDWSFRP